MKKQLSFEIKYGKETYRFEYGSEAYIFHTGIYDDMDKKYGLKVLLEYVAFTQNCYLSDSNRTPLGELADYIAENWKSAKKLDRYELLDEFYSQYE